MMKMRFACVISVLAFFALADVFADRLPSEVKEARARKGHVIRISPDGKAKDTIAWDEAKKTIQPGCALQFTPGNYNVADITELTQDNLVIEGDKSGGMVSAQFVLHGKNNIVRSIRAGRVEGRGLVVVDSLVGRLCFWSDKSRISSYAFNCCFEGLDLYPNNADFEFKNCTIARAASSGHFAAMAGYGGNDAGDWVSYAIYLGAIMEKKGTVVFDDCILYSHGNLFTLPTKESGLLEFDFQNCFIYTKKFLAQAPGKDPKNPLEIKSMKALENYFAIKAKGKVELEDPRFALPYPESGGSWANIAGKHFVLSSGSSAQKRRCGAKIGDVDMPDPMFSLK